jgi:hypothetical protein
MGHRRQFRQLIETAMRKKGWSQGNLAVAIGFLPSGTTLDATGVRRIIRGERPLTSWMLNRLIEVLDLDPAEAEAAAVEDYRTFLAVTGGRTAAVGSNAGSNPTLSHNLRVAFGTVTPLRRIADEQSKRAA